MLPRLLTGIPNDVPLSEGHWARRPARRCGRWSGDLSRASRLWWVTTSSAIATQPSCFGDAAAAERRYVSQSER
jgi:hypothetical protein